MEKENILSNETIETIDEIAQRILREKGDLSIRDLVQGAISPQELQYLLLVIHSNIVKKELTVKRVFKQFKSNRFVQPPIIGQRELLKFDLLALEMAPAEFEAIELSPVNPLGVNGILTKIDQKNVLSTVRILFMSCQVFVQRLKSQKLRDKEKFY